jgi:hypothetical protein
MPDGRSFLIDGERLVAMPPLRSAGSSVAVAPHSAPPVEPGWYDHDEYERPPGPLRYSAPYAGILSVR